MTGATKQLWRGFWPWCAGAFALLAGAVVLTNVTVPTGQAGEGPVDVLLVLGVPARPDGTPSQAERWRVAEAVREYRAGRAPHVLVSGGAAANRFAEADVMADDARRLGLSPDVVLEERQSLTTMENIAASQKILLAHGWHRVEVISSPDHLRRVSVLLARTDLTWRVHAAPTPGRSLPNRVYAYTREAVGTAILRWFGPASEKFLHAFAQQFRRLTHGIEDRL